MRENYNVCRFTLWGRHLAAAMLPPLRAQILGVSGPNSVPARQPTIVVLLNMLACGAMKRLAPAAVVLFVCLAGTARADFLYSFTSPILSDFQFIVPSLLTTNMTIPNADLF